MFDVVAEGDVVLDDLDVFREAGGKNIAYEAVVPVSVSDGRLDLEFLGVAGNAKLSGLEIAAGGPGGGSGEASDKSGGSGGSGGGSGELGGGFAAPFALDGPSLELGDTFLFGFGTDGEAASLGQSGSGNFGVDDVGSAQEIDYRRDSGSEKIGFDFGSAVTGLDLMLGGIGRTSGGKEGAILKTYDAEGYVLDTLLLTQDDNLGLSFSSPVRYATLEASPWISSDGDLPGSEPDFVLNWFETLA